MPSLKDRLNKKDEEDKGVLKYIDRPVSRAIKDEEARQPGGLFPEVAAPRMRDRRSQGVLGQPLKDAVTDAARPLSSKQQDLLSRIKRHEEPQEETDQPDVAQEYYQPQNTPTKGKNYTDSELVAMEKELKDQFERYQNDVNKLDGEDKVDFAEKMGESKTAFQKAEDNLEKRELVELLSNAITQLGAGLYGAKHGVDLSGLPFNKTDWETRYDRNMNKYKTELQRISEDRAASENRRSAAIDRLDRAIRGRSEFALARRGQEEAARRHDDQMAARPDPVDGEGIENMKGRQKQLQDWGTFLRDMQDDKRLENPQLAISEVRRRATSLGVDPEELERVIKQNEGFGWTSKKNARQTAAAVNDLISRTTRQQQEGAGGQQGGLEMRMAERQPGVMAPALFDPNTKQFVRWQ